MTPARRNLPSPIREIGLLATALSALVACGGDVLAPESRDPVLYLVLNHTVTPVETPRQRAFLLTAGTPAKADYRSAEVFNMRRTSDGAPFVWRDLGRVGEARVEVGGARLIEANYQMADSLSDEGLGYAQVEPGRRYDLHVVTEGREIHGSALVPDSFELSVAVEDGRRVAVWPNVDGAAGYSVFPGDGFAELVTDTSFVLDPEDRGTVTVWAADANVFEYLSNEELDRSGVEGALGVFGAITIARAPLPPPPSEKVSSR